MKQLPSCATPRRPCSAPWKGLARAGGSVGGGAVARPAALDLGGGGAQRLQGPSATNAGCSAASRMGGERRRGRSRAGPDRAADGGRRLEAWSAAARKSRTGQRDYAAAAAAVFDPRRSRASPICCSPRPGPGSARHWAISRRPRCGREGGRRGLDLDLHQGAAAPARPRGRAALPRRGRAPARIVIRKGGKIISAC
jgi:hypothetical protein